jgi:hypothetical protein
MIKIRLVTVHTEPEVRRYFLPKEFPFTRMGANPDLEALEPYRVSEAEFQEALTEMRARQERKRDRERKV